MTDPTAMLGFATVSLAVALSPGPSWIYVISTTVSQSRAAGLVAVLGNAVGIICHVAAAVLGLAAILSYSATLYATIRWIGALYLMYLAVKTIRQNTTSNSSLLGANHRSYYGVFRDGVFVNVLNPKVSVLMLALLPQFVDPSKPYVTGQIACFGGLHVLIASLVLTTITFVVSRAARTIRLSPRFDRTFRWISGTLLFGLGARMALTDN